jgi:hypothetical protein
VTDVHGRVHVLAHPSRCTRQPALALCISPRELKRERRVQLETPSLSHFRDASTVPVADRSPDRHSAIESTGFRSLDEGQRLEFDTEPARETQGGRRTRNLILTVVM